MRKLKFAVIGTGFWANYQIPAWQEFEEVELVAVYNRTRSKAEAIAQKFGIPRVYDQTNDLLENEALDFVDIITDVDTHHPFTITAAQKGLHIICQKPMAPTWNLSKEMVQACEAAQVKYFIHENFRWQSPIRRLKKLMDSGIIGSVFKAKVSFCSAFPVFENQPFLKDLKQFILTDIGSHILDICRFLLGEVDTLYCLTARIHPNIQGEDVANVLMKMKNGVHCYAEMSYASLLEKEAFPQTLILLEGEKGSISLGHNYELRVSTAQGTELEWANPFIYAWSDPAYALVHASIVDCHRDILSDLLGQKTAETIGRDNLETVRLVHACYHSANTNQVVYLKDFDE